MRKHYAVAGVVVAILVATLIVVAGSRSSERFRVGSRHDRHTVDAPVGHPAVGTSSARPDRLQRDGQAAADALRPRPRRHQDRPGPRQRLSHDRPAHQGAAPVHEGARRAIRTTRPPRCSSRWRSTPTATTPRPCELLNGVLRADPRSQLAHYDLAGLYFSEQRSASRETSGRRRRRSTPPRASARCPRTSSISWTPNTGRPHPNGAGG